MKNVSFYLQVLILNISFLQQLRFEIYDFKNQKPTYNKTNVLKKKNGIMGVNFAWKWDCRA